MPMYMCLRYKSGNVHTRDLPIFFYYYKQALKYAYKNAVTRSRGNLIPFIYYNVKIFKIPFKYHVCLNAYDDAFYENHFWNLLKNTIVQHIQVHLLKGSSFPLPLELHLLNSRIKHLHCYYFCYHRL